MHVAHAQARLVHKLGQILGHALGQRRDERAVASQRGLAALVDAILHLILDRVDLDRRIDEPGRADHLLGEDVAGLLHLPRPRRGADREGLRAHCVPFVEAQRAVVDATRQAEAVFCKVVFVDCGANSDPLQWLSLDSGVLLYDSYTWNLIS